MTPLETGVCAFIFMFLLDFVWGYYTMWLVERRACLAGSMAVLIVLFNSAVTIFYIGNHWMIVPTALGAFVGTFTAAKTKRLSTYSD